MRIPRVFIDLPLTLNTEIVLPDSRAHYLTNVLRLREGRNLIAFNGDGDAYEASLKTATKKSVTIYIDSIIKTNSESSLKSELAISVSKGDRMDWIVQKATELGVTSISPLITERSELKLNQERWKKKINHWREIIVSACEQCGRNILPILNEQQSLTNYLSECKSTEKFILHPDQDSKNFNDISKPGSVNFLIGPEGGFSDDEVDQAKDNGFVSCSLGPRILRTETAPVVILSIAQFCWGDFEG